MVAVCNVGEMFFERLGHFVIRRRRWIVTAWILFETATGRGRGHLRLLGDLAWTLLTTLTELKGFEEPKNFRRPKGAEHGANPDQEVESSADAPSIAIMNSDAKMIALLASHGATWRIPVKLAD